MSSSLICTVGASLISNISKDDELRKLYEAKETEKIGQYFVDSKEDPEKEQMFSAEINSIASIVALKYISERKHLHFLVSDTADGKKVGAILKYYFEHSKLAFEKVEVHYNQLPEGARIFFDVDRIDNKKYITINPMGQTYLEIVRNNAYNRSKKVIIEKATTFKFTSNNTEGHSLPMIQKYHVDEILRDFGYITEARVLKYSAGNNDKQPYVSIRGDELTITFHTKNGILHVAAKTTARDKNELEMIRQNLKDYLADEFG